MNENKYLLSRDRWILQKKAEIITTLSKNLSATALFDDSLGDYCFDIEDDNGDGVSITMILPRRNSIYVTGLYDFNSPAPIVPSIRAAVQIVKIFEKDLNIIIEWR
jgi:hypothetical protein